MNLNQAIKKLEDHPKWEVFPSSNSSNIKINPRGPEVTLPNDLIAFYELCGGLKFNVTQDDDIFLSILPPSQVNWAVEEIYGNLGKDEFIEAHRDVYTWFWYLIGRGDTDEFILMDLAPERYGICYFSSFYFFGQPKNTWVISRNFLGLLDELHRASDVGKNWFTSIEQGERLEEILIR